MILDAEPHSHTGFDHEALLYAGLDDFVREVAAFTAEGVDAGEPVLVVVGDHKINALREELGTRADHIRFADMGGVGRNPSRIIGAWTDFLAGRDGAPMRGVGEPIWAERSAAEVSECQRHEALLNIALADAFGCRLLCPYDTDSLSSSVIDEALRSHPIIDAGGVRRPSESYLPVQLIDPFSGTLPEPLPPVLTLSFKLDDLRHIRQSVTELAASIGLSRARACDAAVAVTEAATNSVMHGGGRGTVRIWTDGDELVCEVRDTGVITEPLAGRIRPRVTGSGGYGLWLANQLSDLTEIRTDAAGSTVRLHFSR